MKKRLPDKDLPIIEPLYDTWCGKSDAASWGFEFNPNPVSLSLQEINQWYFKVLRKSLDAFSYLARAWKVSITLADQSEITGETLEWKADSNITHQQYIENVLNKIQNYPYEIYEITAELDLFVFVRTKESYPKPVQNWIRNLANLAVAIEIEDNEPYLDLSLDHTLFYPFSYRGDDNSELFELNKPLLEEALRNWEQKFDVEIDFEGLKGIYKYGFFPEEQ